MNKKTSSILWWILAVIFTLGLATYQRLTGPTYPVRGNVELNGNEIKYRLVRSADSDGPAEIRLKNVPEDLSAELTYKRFKVAEEQTVVPFSNEGNDLVAFLPEQPPAGKLEYNVTLTSGGTQQKLSEESVVIRFKGPVPSFVLLPHILFMFLAMLFSTRTGIEALRNGSSLLNYSGITLLLLLAGGMILGPIVQKYAFDAYWTGWPFGQDLTDNKTLVAFVAWVVAWFRIRKSTGNRWWAVVAAIILLAVYLIPHSMFGSELDYTTGEVTTGE